MSAEIQWDIQTAIYNKLTADSNLANIVGSKIYDHVPENTDFPYIIIKDMMAEEFDSQIGNGLKVRFSIESYSDYQGSKESKEIMRYVYDLLHNVNDINVTAHNVILSRFINAKTSLDSAGKIRIANQVFEIITEE